MEILELYFIHNFTLQINLFNMPHFLRCSRGKNFSQHFLIGSCSLKRCKYKSVDGNTKGKKKGILFDNQNQAPVYTLGPNKEELISSFWYIVEIFERISSSSGLAVFKTNPTLNKGSLLQDSDEPFHVQAHPLMPQFFTITVNDIKVSE